MPHVKDDTQDKQRKQRNLEKLKDPEKAAKGRGADTSGGAKGQASALDPRRQPGFDAQAAALALRNRQALGGQHRDNPGKGLPPLPRIPNNAQAQAPVVTAPQRPVGPAPVRAPQRPGAPAPQLPAVEAAPAAEILTGKDEKRDIFGRSNAKTLSAGTANEVTKVEYNKGIGGGAEKRGFWKQGGISGAADVVGIDKTPGQDKMRPSKKDPTKMIVNPNLEKTTDPRLAARAVASSRMDKALGTNVLADEAFAEHKGQMGNVSAMVPGRALMQNKLDEDKKISGQDLAQVDAKDPAYQKSMANLGVVDYLSGQIDRHAGNIFYDPKSGTAKGIDNDLAFGQFDHQSAKGLGAGNALDALPKQIDADTAKVIRDMGESKFRASIEGRKGDPEALHESEIAKAVERFRALKAHIAELAKKGALVQKWDDQTYADACNDPTGTYLGRQEDRIASATSVETVTPVAKDLVKKKNATD